jgi:hypothetical protein
MKDYVMKILVEFIYREQLQVIKNVTTPAAKYLFQLNDEAIKSSSTMAEEFHATVAKVLFFY